MKLGLEHHTGNEAGMRARWGNLRFKFPLLPSATRLGEREPPPTCCADDPGDVLDEVSSDLETFFDKWYGSGNKTTTDGYYTWSSPCGTPGIFVATTSKIDDAQVDLCGENPLIHEIFNRFRDAIVYMSRIQGDENTSIRRRPKASTTVPPNCSPIGCDDLQKFNVKFTPTRACDHPSPCVSGAVGGTSQSTRVSAGEKLCMFHYQELVDIVDDILANGVVQFKATVRPASPCLGTTEGQVCLVNDRTDYSTGDPTDDCCRSESGECLCCLGPDPSITSFYEEFYWGTFDDASNDVNGCVDFESGCYESNGAGCYPTPLRDNVPWEDACIYERVTVTQVGASQWFPENCFFVVNCRVVHTIKGVGSNQLPFCLDVTTLRDDIQPIIFSYNQVNQSSDCAWTFTFVGFLNPFCRNNWEEDWPGEACDGATTTYLEGCCRDGGFPDNRVIHEWLYRTISVDADNSTCDAECEGTGCPCPGPVASTDQTALETAVAIAQPRTTKTRTDDCGAGFDEIVSIDYQIKYGGSCPDSGLTNIVMLDPRITGTVDATYRTKTVDAPLFVTDPPCPGNAEKVCDPLCLKGYGELGP